MYLEPVGAGFMLRRKMTALTVSPWLDEAFLQMISKTRLLLLVPLNLALVIAVLFIPAGSLKFWEGWAYIAAAYVPTILTYLYLYKYDPELFMRRLQRKEKLREQKLLRRAFTPLTVVGVVIPGLDYRFGWSRDLGGVPLWLALLSQALVLGGVVLVFWAMKVNSFASKTIQVEPEQTVISTGPYGIVRHPFYLGCVMISLFTPLALGSYIALPVWALGIVFFVLRLVSEERLLRQELPGYSGYCLRTRFRLVPYVW